MSGFYLVIDVEATCWERNPAKAKEESEIIEIGAVVFDPQNRESLAELQTFVKPVRNPILSPFCTSLTSITQHDVDTAPEFPQALRELQEQILDQYPCTFSSWGDYDRKQFHKDCEWHKVKYPFGEKHVNVKQLFAERKQCRPCGMAQALKMLGFPLQGTHHRALDDTRNIVRIFETIL